MSSLSEYEGGETAIANCGSCRRGWRNATGSISCGAAVDDLALRDGDGGKNPIWATRKYSKLRILMILAGAKVTGPDGTDCDHMNPDDGNVCKTWEAGA